MRNKQTICIKNGKVWERSTLHLKSAVHNYSRYNILKQIELDLLKRQIG